MNGNNNIETKIKLFEIKNLLQDWHTSYRENRHEEATTARLRISHTHTAKVFNQLNRVGLTVPTENVFVYDQGQKINTYNKSPFKKKKKKK